VTAKAHGGPIEIFGVTVAKVDDKVRVQALETWMDPLAMFRQIAPYGVVNKEPMNRKVDKTEALDAAPEHDGIKIAKEFNDQGLDGVSSSQAPEHIPTTNGQSTSAGVQNMAGCPFAGQSGMETVSLPQGHPDVAMNDSTAADQAIAGTSDERLQPNEHDGTRLNGSSQPTVPPVETTQGAADTTTTMNTMTLDGSPQKRAAEEDIPRSLYSSAVTGNVEDVVKVAKSENFGDESVASGTYDDVDRHLESSAEQVHPHPKQMEEAVQPGIGEAIAVPTNSEETRKTVQEMSEIKPEETDLIMNRE
jgi:hypothetical protein